jgi:uncharacterized protein YaaW (UPF0174 family)
MKKRQPPIREGLEPRRQAAQSILARKLTDLAQRRKTLVEAAKFDADPAKRRLASAKIRDLDDSISKFQRELKQLSRWAICKFADRLEVGSRTSMKSSNISKMTSTKPYRG